MKQLFLILLLSCATIAKSDTEILFNVRDYGATGNGVSDDTSAIQAAITAATPYGTVYFPNGSYKITSTIVLGTGLATNSISIKGQSREGAVIRYTPSVASGVALRFNTNSHAIFQDFSLTNYAGSQGTTEGIQFSGPINSGTQNKGNYFRNIGVANFFYDVHLDDGTGTTGSECTFDNVDTYGATAGFYSHNANAYNSSYRNCGANGCTTGFWLVGGTHYFYGGHTYSNGTDFRLEQTQDSYISNIYSEGAGVGLYLKTNHTFISNCTISGTPVAAVQILSGDITLAGCRLAGPIQVWSGHLRVDLVSTGVYAPAPVTVIGNVNTDFEFSFTNVAILRKDLTPIIFVPNKSGTMRVNSFKDIVYPPRRITFSNIDFAIPAPVITSSPVTTVAQTGTMTAPRSVMFPSASSFYEGTGFDLTDESGTVGASTSLACFASGADKINGASQFFISQPYGSVKFVSNGTNKWIAK